MRRFSWFTVWVIIVFIIGGAVAAAFFLRSSADKVVSTGAAVPDKAAANPATKSESVLNLLPTILGFSRPTTVLFLFQNNTELRPTGGFIGAYATVRFDKGRASLLAVEGSEVLDKRTPDSWRPVPPAPIGNYLKVDRWYFRDSNWSPDFSVSALRALNFYTAEGGLASGDIDLVVAVTPTVLEALLSRIGAVTVEGLTFTPERVVETLEYNVEYGYEDRGLAFIDRKKILAPLLREVARRLAANLIFHFGEYQRLAETLLREKQVMVFAKNSEQQAIFDRGGWSGRVRSGDGDYLLWVDANLGALKTDHALTRTLQYSLKPLPEVGGWSAEATMAYEHRGTFDWRTSRYQSYVRLYVPSGAALQGVFFGDDQNQVAIDSTKVDQGTELGKQWFGTFIRIEPGARRRLRFAYTLSSSTTRLVEAGEYSLLVQKQSGTIAHGLTLRLDFGTTTMITAATPGEQADKWGDGVYEYSTDLSTDRDIMVTLRQPDT
ncbi:MAG: DUF4012 domain-containing protein [Candidatus Magasanikbacteria bacterium]|nr:DUF4012 domain-containing protein [Candidatus Magasanikbacteria bacterium]